MGLEIGPLHLRRSGLVRATPERVWQEFETFERLAAWYGTGHTLEHYEPELGGRIELSVVIDGAKHAFGGRIVTFEPNRELSFTSQWSSGGWAVPTFHTLRLTALYDACLVEIFHHGFERLGEDAADELEGHEEGWDNHHVKALRAIVEGDGA